MDGKNESYETMHHTIYEIGVKFLVKTLTTCTDTRCARCAFGAKFSSLYVLMMACNRNELIKAQEPEKVPRNEHSPN